MRGQNFKVLQVLTRGGSIHRGNAVMEVFPDNAAAIEATIPFESLLDVQFDLQVNGKSVKITGPVKIWTRIQEQPMFVFQSICPRE